jgi:hypothetical protein
VHLIIALFTNVHKNHDTKTNSAVRALERRLIEIEAEAEEVRASIEILKGAAPAKDTQSNPAVRPGQYAGMKRSEALRAYLNERPGGVTFTKALNDLLLGGLERTKEGRDNRRYLTTTITQNPELFERDPDTDVIRLKSEKKK